MVTPISDSSLSTRGGTILETTLGHANLSAVVYPSTGVAPFYYFPTIFGEQQAVANVPYAAWRFDYNVNTRIVTPATANGASVTASESKAVLSTGTNTAGAASVQTIRTLRYLPGVGGLLRFTAVFTEGVEDSQQIIGIGNTEDGYFFGYNGAEFGIMRRRAGVDNWTPQADWNGAPVNFSPQLGNVYGITFQWLGFGFIAFLMVNPEAFNERPFHTIYRVVHFIKYPNTSDDVSILNPTLPVYAAVENSGNNTNIVLQSPSACAFLQGGPALEVSPLDVTNTADTLVTISDTNNNHILTIRNKTTFNGLSNRIPVEISSVTIGRAGTSVPLTQVRFYRVPTTAAPLVYADVDTNNSPMEASTTTTTITAGAPVTAIALSDAFTVQYLPFKRGELVLQPGEQLTVGFQNSAATGTAVTVTIVWNEQF